MKLQRWFRTALLVVLAALVTACSAGVQAQAVRLGIIQIVEHPSLDQARQGFLDRLEELGYTVQADYQNAQGDMATATSSPQLPRRGQDLVLAIATPTAQAMAQATTTFPSSSPRSPTRKRGLVDGTSALAPTSPAPPISTRWTQLAWSQGLVPDARPSASSTTLGEVNSVVQVEWARRVAAKLGLTLVAATMTASGEVCSGQNPWAGSTPSTSPPTTRRARPEAVVQVAETKQVRLPRRG